MCQDDAVVDLMLGTGTIPATLICRVRVAARRVLKIAVEGLV
jgi:hypothetical protein